jgi:predicted Zn-dependent peptidase
MKASWLTLALLLICISLSAVGAQNLEDRVTEFTLDNGMKFLVVERHVSPVFFGALAFNVGSLNEWDGVTGISHLLEHMMFKGTETVGTRNYSRERPILAREDEIAGSIQDLRRQIGAWRLDIFEAFARTSIASLDEANKQEIGSDRIKELAALISMLEDGNHVPPEADTYPTLLESDGNNYLDRYIDLKKAELELETVMLEHRDLIIKDELWDTYLKNGGRMLNAFTANDMTGYIVYLPANRLELWMMLESDRMRDPVFREFYSERNVVAEERRLHENDPESALYDELMAAAFTASPYGRPVVGWMSDIQSITRQDLIAYNKRFYAPNNVVAVLVGDLDVGEVRKLAAKYFSRIPAQKPPDPIDTREPEQVGERRVVVEFPANPRVMIGYHVPVAPHPDSYAVDALSSILGSGRTSRLYRIYEELELTSGAPAVSFEPGHKVSNLLVISAVPRHPHTTEEVEQAIYREIEAIQNEPPTEREVQRLRNRIDATMVRTLGSNLGLAFNLGSNAVIRGDWHAYLDDYEKTKQVGPDEISAVARKYLVPRNRTVATLVKEEVKQEGQEQRAKEEPEEIDIGGLMQWIRSLPEDEQKEIFQRLRSMTEDERKAYARELMKRMES